MWLIQVSWVTTLTTIHSPLSSTYECLLQCGGPSDALHVWESVDMSSSIVSASFTSSEILDTCLCHHVSLPSPLGWTAVSSVTAPNEGPTLKCQPQSLLSVTKQLLVMEQSRFQDTLTVENLNSLEQVSATTFLINLPVRRRPLVGWFRRKVLQPYVHIPGS